MSKKNELEERCEYLTLKEKRERYINYILIILILLFLIFTFIYINSSKPKKSEEIAYVDTSNSEVKSETSFIRFIYDGFNHNTPPNKNNYEISSVSCNNAKGSWDNKKWQLNISNIVDKVSCSLNFKKKEIKNTFKKKSNTTKNMIKKETSTVSNEYLVNEINEEDIKEENNNQNIQVITTVEDELLFDYDKCDINDECNYKVVMDSNRELKLKPFVVSLNKEIKYELIKGDEAISLYGSIVYSKNVAYKEAYVKAYIIDNPSLSVIIKIIVEAKLINTRVYPINRNNETINRVEPKTSFQTFINNIMNLKDKLFVYDLRNKIINDNSKYLGSGMKLKLIIDNKIYDELEIIVLGDLDGDGDCTSFDYDIISEYVYNDETLTSTSLLAADINNDKKVDDIDLELIYDYSSNYITSFPIP